MSEAKEKYVCFISYLCKKYILLSFHNAYVILFHINYWKFISGRGGSVNTLHKLKRNIALLIIFFMFGMCFAPYQTRSSLYASISADSATFYFGSDKISANNTTPCTREMLQERIYNLCEQYISRSTNARNSINRLAYAPGLRFVPRFSQNYYFISFIILFCPVLPGTKIINYLHKSDGKKRL